MTTLWLNNQRTVAEPYEEAAALLDKLRSGQNLTKKETNRLKELASKNSGLTNQSFLGSPANLRDTLNQLVKSGISPESFRKIQQDRRREAAQSAPTPVQTIADVRGDTQGYNKRIKKQQKKEAKLYQGLVSQQQSAFAGQLAAQNQMLNQQLQTITQQSTLQQQRYQALMRQTTRQQQQQLTAIRRQYNRGNRKSERTIARLQDDIKRLSTINRPPNIPIDTRPAVIGLSAAQQSSQQRQTLGLVGTRKAPAQTGTLGLDIAS
jgi:hypothetical protein